MKTKFSLLAVNLLLLGCVNKTITIDNHERVGSVVAQPPRTIYREEVFVEEPYVVTPNVEHTNVVATIEEPVAPQVVRTQRPFNISPLEANDMLHENMDVFLLDVRMANEIPVDGKIANSVMIPLQVLGQNLNRLDKSKTILVYCHTGNRSVEATRLLRARGYDAINMSGGIEAWKQNHLNVVWK